jgi:hypothetical protein
MYARGSGKIHRLPLYRGQDMLRAIRAERRAQNVALRVKMAQRTLCQSNLLISLSMEPSSGFHHALGRTDANRTGQTIVTITSRCCIQDFSGWRDIDSGDPPSHLGLGLWGRLPNRIVPSDVSLGPTRRENPGSAWRMNRDVKRGSVSKPAEPHHSIRRTIYNNAADLYWGKDVTRIALAPRRSQ